MQTNINIPVAEMLPLIKEKIENGGIAEMTVTGDSMLPLLIDRVSSVRLIKPERLKRGDIVLFQRSNGALVLHRIIRIRDGKYDIIGDNQKLLERAVGSDQIIAKISEYNRTGKRWVKESGIKSFVISSYKLFFHYLWWGKRHVLRRKI